MPTIEEVTEKLRTLDDSRYLAAVSYIFYLADAPIDITVKPEGKSRERKKALYAAGILRKYANPSLIAKEKNAWMEAAVKKYESDNT